MIKDRNTTIAYHCPFCGLSILNEINMFSMNGNLIKMKCVCGGSELVVQITKDKKFRITVPCIVCPNSHSFTVSSGIFFEKDLFAFACTFTSIDICFLGKNKKVYDAIKKNEKELIEAFAQYENDYSQDMKDNPGFTTSFPGDDSDSRHSHCHNHNDTGIDLFYPFGRNNDDMEDDDFDDIDDIDDDIVDDFWDFWEGSEFSDVLESGRSDNIDLVGNSSKKNDMGFEIYRTGLDDGSETGKSKHINNNKSKNANGNIEIDSTIDFTKIKVKSYPIILHILNVISDLYKENKIFCKCGHFDGKIVILDNFVHIECKNCASERKIKSSNVSDIEYIAELGELYLDFE